MTGMDPRERPADGDTAPLHGEVVTLRFDGREVSVWWGPDGDIEPLATRCRHILTWPTADAWPALGRVENRCHGKLTAADVPWLVGEDVYQPRWTAMELRCLRKVLNESVHALRTGLS